MEPQAIHPHDLAVIAAIKAGDSVVTRQFFYEELSGMLETIRHKVFDGRIPYDELVSELYLILSADTWRRLDTFAARGECRLRTWTSAVAWRHFLRQREEMPVENPDTDEAGQHALSSSSDIELQMAIDVRDTLRRMPNRRYARILSMLLIEGFTPKETAEAMGTTTDNIYNMKRRAIDQFISCYH